MLPLSTIEQTLSCQGYFSLFDWLLAENLLAYDDYEAWRNRRIDSLDGLFVLDHAALDQLIHDSEAHARALGLEAVAQSYFAWGGSEHAGDSALDRPLQLSAAAHRQQALSQRWQRPQGLSQLDLFMDNATLVAETSLGEALTGRRWERAEEALQRLTRLNPDHRHLGRYSDLLNYARHIEAEPLAAPANLATELAGLEQEVMPLARELLPASGRDYLAHAWRRLADSLAGMTFDPEQPQRHASYALARIPDWRALEQTLIADAVLQQHPPLLERLGLCFTHTGRQAEATALWCGLFDRFPAYAEQAIGRSGNPSLQQHWRNFWETDDDWQAGDFASFLLIEQPGLLGQLKALPALHTEATQRVAELLICHRQGEEEINARRQLQQISPSLLKHYLQRFGRAV